ncbi:MAG: hypothetical protein M0R46_12385 [Candidatus Muirbacterium halophilum]|nr:hypothetical protein [Candidatus Muirbacterium halophilum]MCK9476714.1 hypothetical protein [Candidatus Muirbacterium halophilum]
MNNELKSDIVDFLGFLPPWNETFFYNSQKNSVARYENTVFKFFCFGDLQKEADIYAKCLKNNIKTPKVLKVYKNTLVLEFIKEDKDISQIEKLKKSFEWLLLFHKKIGISKGDQRLFNYLYNSGKIYGIDFEESDTCSINEDIASLITTARMNFSKSDIDVVLSDIGFKVNDEIENLICKEMLIRQKFKKKNI